MSDYMEKMRKQNLIPIFLGVYVCNTSLYLYTVCEWTMKPIPMCGARLLRRSKRDVLFRGFKLSAVLLLFLALHQGMMSFRGRSSKGSTASMIANAQFPHRSNGLVCSTSPKCCAVTADEISESNLPPPTGLRALDYPSDMVSPSTM